jgi:hypothetical protein
MAAPTTENKIIYNIEQNSELLFQRLKLYICFDILNTLEILHDSTDESDKKDFNSFIFNFLPFINLFTSNQYNINTKEFDLTAPLYNYKLINYALYKYTRSNYKSLQQYSEKFTKYEADILKDNIIYKTIIRIIKYILLSNVIKVNDVYSQICLNIYLFETRNDESFIASSSPTNAKDKLSSILDLLMRLFTNTVSFYLYNLRFLTKDIDNLIQSAAASAAPAAPAAPAALQNTSELINLMGHKIKLFNDLIDFTSILNITSYNDQLAKKEDYKILIKENKLNDFIDTILKKDYNNTHKPFLSIYIFFLAKIFESCIKYDDKIDLYNFIINDDSISYALKLFNTYGTTLNYHDEIKKSIIYYIANTICYAYTLNPETAKIIPNLFASIENMYIIYRLHDYDKQHILSVIYLLYDIIDVMHMILYQYFSDVNGIANLSAMYNQEENIILDIPTYAVYLNTLNIVMKNSEISIEYIKSKISKKEGKTTAISKFNDLSIPDKTDEFDIFFKISTTIIEKKKYKDVIEFLNDIYYTDLVIDDNYDTCNTNIYALRKFVGGSIEIAKISFENPLYLLNYTSMNLCNLNKLYTGIYKYVFEHNIGINDNLKATLEAVTKDIVAEYLDADIINNI